MSACVLLHGFALGPSSWGSVPGFAPASVGHADAVDVEVASFEAEVDRLASRIEAETRGPRHLVGYSMGGRLGLGLLARHPRLFDSATLVSAHPGLRTEAERAARREADGRWAELLREAGVEAFASAFEAQPIFLTRARAPEARVLAQAKLRRSHTSEGLVRSLRCCGLGAMPCLEDALPEIATPVDLVVGVDDAKFLALARSMAERLPRARLCVIEDAGHDVPLERPDALLALLRPHVEGGALRGRDATDSKGARS
jgi:2-succinyl-6-hydroxy-2,4-cyclohexadiene-1-carboxylate synthase